MVEPAAGDRPYEPIRADGLHLRTRYARTGGSAGGASECGRQPVRQRQADRRGDRPAAFRRHAWKRHERQGGLMDESAALDLAANHQRQLRACGTAAPARMRRLSGIVTAIPTPLDARGTVDRSEERRVGKEWRPRW